MTSELREFEVFGFSSVHDALDAEAVLRREGLATVAIPSPRELGELCGVALRIEIPDAARAADILAGAGRAPVATTRMKDR